MDFISNNKFTHYIKLAFILCTISAAVLIGFQNCSKKTHSSGVVDNNSLRASDERLVRALESARSLLNELALMPQDSDVIQLTSDLNQALENLERLVYEERRPNHDPYVLVEMDYLILAISQASDFTLEKRIAALEAEVAQLRQDIEDIFGFLVGPFDSIQEKIDELKLAIDLSNGGFVNYTQMSISALLLAQEDLANKLLQHEEQLQGLFDAQQSLEDLQNRVCEFGDDNADPCDADQSVNFALADTADLGSFSCNCIDLPSIDCNVMFPGDDPPTPATRAQCNIFLGVLVNHDQQLRAINELDIRQNEMIANLNDRVGDLEVDMLDIQVRVYFLELKAARSEAGASLLERVDHIRAWGERRLSDINYTFCHKRTSNALNKFDYETARHNWVLCHERMTIVKRAIEKANIASSYVNGAMSANVDDLCTHEVSYDANGDGAPEMVAADSLVPDNIEAFADTNLFNDIFMNCRHSGGQTITQDNYGDFPTHGSAIVIGSLIRANELLNSLAPDFRTPVYMGGKATIAQKLAFNGKTYNDLTPTERGSWSDIVPTSGYPSSGSGNWETPYGQVERLFVHNYIDNIFRDVYGRFPATAADIRENNQLHVAWTHAELVNQAASPYIQAIKAIEVDHHGWRVVGRNPDLTSNGNPIVDKSGADLYSFPRDAVKMCPIENQDVVLKNSDGNYYVYTINYKHVYEIVRPRLSGGMHVKILSANQTGNADSGSIGSRMNNGQFNGSRHGACVQAAYGAANSQGSRANIDRRWIIRATQPYGTTFGGNQGQCVKFTAVCYPRFEDNNPHPYTNTKYGYFGSNGNSSPLNSNGTNHWLNNIINNSSNNVNGFNRNPLGSGYWVNKAVNGAAYGVNNDSVNAQTPLYGNDSSRGWKFIKIPRTNTNIN